MAAAIVILTLISAGLCHKLAKDRRRSSAIWIALAALFGPLAVVALLLLPKETDLGNTKGDA